MEPGVPATVFLWLETGEAIEPEEGEVIEPEDEMELEGFEPSAPGATL